MSDKAALPSAPAQPHRMQPETHPAVYAVTVLTSPPGLTSTPSSVREHYPGVSSIVIGVIRIVLVGVAIIVDAATLEQKPSRKSWFECVWIGIFFIASGALGIVAGRKKTQGLITAHMVMSIVGAALFAPVQFVVTFFITLMLSFSGGIVHSVQWVLMFITIIQFLLNVAGSILGCVGLCKPCKYTPQEYSAVQTVIPLAQTQPQPEGYADPPPAYAETANDASLQTTNNDNVVQVIPGKQ